MTLDSEYNLMYKEGCYVSTYVVLLTADTQTNTMVV